MCRYDRIPCPKIANSTITSSATSTACRAARERAGPSIFEVSPRKIGTVPGGSMITNSVTKVAPSSCRFTTASDAHGSSTSSRPAASIRSSWSGRVTFSPNRFCLPAPW